MLDQYVVCDHRRMSPECPTAPVLNHIKTDNRLGGAANVALNIESLQMNAILLSVRGDDSTGLHLKSLLDQTTIEHHLIIDSDRISTLKRRYVDKDYKQILRYDNEQTKAIEGKVYLSVCDKLKQIITQRPIDAIIIQDYNKGIINLPLINEIRMHTHGTNIKVLVDPKQDNFIDLAQFDVFKPNLKEVQSFLGMETVINKQELDRIVKPLNYGKQTKVFITLGADGIYYCDNTTSGIITGHPITKPDVSGAGDTVISALTYGLLKGNQIKQIAEIANLAGAKVCQKEGVSVVTLDEIKS